MAGCSLPRGGPVKIEFSPDGTNVAYLWEDRLEEPVVDGRIWCRTISLHWCKTSAPEKESSTSVETLGTQFAGCLNVPLEIKWSPHGHRIGVLTPHRLTLVEAGSQNKKTLEDRTITSFTWLSDDEVAYCTRRTWKGMQSRVIICRQKLDDGQAKTVAGFDWHPASKYTWKEHWAPSGQYVIFMEPDIGGRFHVVDVLGGASRAFGQTNACDIGVAWDPESSRAFCVSRKVGPWDVFEAVLLYPVTGNVVDCTPGFQGRFAGHMPNLIPIWTVDGKYVLVNALDISGHLVRPDPWEAVPLGQSLAHAFKAPKDSTIAPWLFRLPVGGWVGVIPTGNEGNSPVKYAADYLGHSVIPLLEDYRRAISPDGTMAATIGEDGRIKIRSLGKWWLPSAKSHESMPDSSPAPRGAAQ